MVSTYENMKQTNITEIGNIPSDWSLIKLKFFSNIYGRIGFRGYTASDLVDEGEGAITLGPPNIENQKLNLKEKKYLSWEKYDESPEIKIYDGDLLLVKTASVGKVALVENLNYPTTINPQLTVFKNIQINNKYFYYTMVSDVIQHQIASNTNGGVIFTLSQENIQNYNIPLPSDEEQKQIADYLDQKTAKIDATIAKNEELIQLLEEKRVALINQVVTKGLNPDVPMKDSGVEWIGEIPEHWDITKVKHELDFLDHKRIPLSAEVRSDMDRIYDYYGASGVIDKVDSYLFNGKYILVGEDGANLLSRSTPLAFIAEGKFWVNNHAHILNPKDENNIDYFVSLLEAVDYTPFIEGSAQPKLTADNLKNIILIKPPLVEQNEIAKFLNLKLNHNNHTLSKIQENINLLEEYKTSLIHHVVTGKVDVRGEEI